MSRGTTVHPLETPFCVLCANKCRTQISTEPFFSDPLFAMCESPATEGEANHLNS